MSIETTKARFAANAAEREWKEHRGHCAQCGRAVRSREWGQVCGEGNLLLGAQKDTARELAASRKLDSQPSPGQQALL